MNHPDILDRLQRHRDRIAASTIDTVARHLAALALEIQESPVLGPALAGLLGSPAPWIGSPEEPPTDLHTWGADAAAVLLTALHEVREGRPFYHCLMPFLNESHRRVLRDESSRTYLLSMFIDPILEWAAFTLGALPAFSETVRRWAIRVEAFGIPGLPTRSDLDANPAHDFPDEHAFQLDLARFLYDQGFDLGRLGREQVLRERTGQGARIDFLLRDQREVAVELMVARSGSSLSAINHHVVELRDYCRTGKAAHGMLVVVNLDPKRRLDIRPAEATAPAGVQTGGAHLLITVVEAMRANASAEGGRPVAIVDLTGALA